jgi:hypothetical protein|tara:strand:+ start:140 stop:385 length:246 start_codon:yes stop_codon:yes gene_type:complete
MDANSLVKLVNDFGFPVVLAVLMMGFIWYMFKYVTTELKPKLNEANGVLIGLIDRIRMLDNDLIRLKTKIETVKKQKAKKK